MAKRPTAPRMADLVRGALADAGLTQERIAAVLSLSQVAVSRRVRGSVDWRAEELATLDRDLGVDVARFFPHSASHTTGDAA